MHIMSYCQNPFCCPKPGCRMKHHDGHVIARRLSVCEFFPRCLDCREYHPNRVPMRIHQDPTCRSWGCTQLHKKEECPQKCYETDCRCPDKRHRPRNAGGPHRLCGSLLFHIMEFLTLKDARSLRTSSFGIHENMPTPILRYPLFTTKGIESEKHTLETQIHNEDVSQIGIHVMGDGCSYRRRYSIYNIVKEWPVEIISDQEQRIRSGDLKKNDSVSCRDI